VLVLDRKEQRLVVADFGTGIVVPIGRTGSGPREYRNAAALLALPGDSTLLADVENARWLLLDHADIVATLPPTNLAIMQTFVTVPSGADRRGYVLSKRLRGRNGGSQDSVDLILIERRTGRTEYVGALLARRAMPPARPTADGRIYRVPLVGGEEALLFSDGWVAIARIEPYRMDWRSPDGHWTHGAPLPFTPVHLDAREREAYIHTHPWARNVPVWPETAPAFDVLPLLAAPNQLLAIARVASADHPEARYELVDRQGMLRGQLRLTGTDRLVGFGAAAAYIVTTDDDGIRRLQRHPWP
jgi:hypothetical protein